MQGAQLSNADFRLVRRLEYGHADSGTSYARACLARFPDTVTAFEQIAGGWAIFQGSDSPQTQALAVGMNGPVSAEEFARLEHFYHSRNAPAVLDLSLMTDATVLNELQGKKVLIRELSNVMARIPRADEEYEVPSATDIEQTPIGESREWGRLVLRAFSGEAEPTQEQLDLISATPPELRVVLR